MIDRVLSRVGTWCRQGVGHRGDVVALRAAAAVGGIGRSPRRHRSSESRRVGSSAARSGPAAARRSRPPFPGHPQRPARAAGFARQSRASGLRSERTSGGIWHRDPRGASQGRELAFGRNPDSILITDRRSKCVDRILCRRVKFGRAGSTSGSREISNDFSTASSTPAGCIHFSHCPPPGKADPGLVQTTGSDTPVAQDFSRNSPFLTPLSGWPESWKARSIHSETNDARFGMRTVCTCHS